MLRNLIDTNRTIAAALQMFHSIRIYFANCCFSGTTCSEDWVEAWWVGREETRVPLGRWCGLATPGPLHSPRGASGLVLALHTDVEAVASGFKARYVFEAWLMNILFIFNSLVKQIFCHRI